jgi:hypothetical protein
VRNPISLRRADGIDFEFRDAVVAEFSMSSFMLADAA